MKHTIAERNAARQHAARPGAARTQLSLGMFALLAWLVGNHVVGCGDSGSSTPSTATNSNLPGGQGSNASGNGTGNGTANSPSATPGGESTPNNIALDPNRDPSQPINLVASGGV